MDPRCQSGSIFGIREVESRARIPFPTLISVGREAARRLQHPGEVEEVPCHEGRVAIGELVVDPDPTPILELVPIAGTRARLTDPSGVRLGRDRVPDVLQAVEDVRRAVLDSVFVSRNQASSDSPVEEPLALVVELT